MSEHIRDRCPSCGSSGSLFIGTGGYLTCSLIGCPEPGLGRAIANLQTRIEALEEGIQHTREILLRADEIYYERRAIDYLAALAAEEKT